MKTLTDLDSRWLCMSGLPKPDPEVRLLCLPFAGGGASIYAPWLRAPPARLEVLPVQLPGREHRIRESPYYRMEPLLDALMCTLVEPLPGSIALFGHSMGAIIATELARRMSERGRPPLRLFVSGATAPHVERTYPRFHELGATELVTRLQQLNGLSPEVVASPELLDLFIPLLYADMELTETGHYPRPHLECPITVFTALEDPLVDEPGLAAWEQATQASCTFHRLRGDHFFILSMMPWLLEQIALELGLQ